MRISSFFFWLQERKNTKQKQRKKLLSNKSYPTCISMEVEGQLRRRLIKLDKGGDRFSSYLG
jgi:hypothetical protein